MPKPIVWIHPCIMPAKRLKTLADRGIDFAKAADVFKGPTLDSQDTRKDYGETRIVSVEFLLRRYAMLFKITYDE